MYEGPSQTNGFLRFWTSVPGVLTAVAAVITAVGSIYFTSASGSSPSPPPVPPTNPTPMVVVNLSQAAAAAPAVSGQIPASQLDLTQVESNISLDSAGVSLLNRCADGDNSACLQIVEGLINECDQGYGISCDALYEISPAGSEYQWFGATCGGRVSSSYADRCKGF